MSGGRLRGHERVHEPVGVTVSSVAPAEYGRKEKPTFRPGAWKDECAQGEVGFGPYPRASV